MKSIGLAVLTATALLTGQASVAQEQEVAFVRAGKILDAREVGARWERTEGYVRCSGVGNLLRAERDVGGGDVTIRATVVLEALEGTAASLALGATSHFGFDGRGGRVFVEGPMFGGFTDLGPAADRIRAGVPFVVGVERRGTTMRLSIDGESVHEAAVPEDDSLGSIALRPWRATMRVLEFAARGDLVDAAPWIVDDAVFAAGRGGYHTVRIPALVTTTRGTLLAFCEGRRSGRGDSGDIDLLVRRSTDGGRTWSGVDTVWDHGENTCGNPCPVVDRRSGDVVLLMTWNDGRDRESAIIAQESIDTRRVFVCRSGDDGRSWSEPAEITADVKDPSWTWYATGPGNGIQLERGEHAGRLVVPCDHIEAGTRRYLSHCILSDDGGRTWRAGGSTPEPAVNECAVVERTDGSLLLDMRNYDRAKHTRQVATSTDGGESWSNQRHDPTRVEPICQASLVRWRWPTDEQPGALLFSNPASADARVRMTVRLSEDDGRTWPQSVVLHDGPSAYSSLSVLPDGRGLCLFEAGEAHPYEAIVLREVRFEADDR